MSGHPPPDQHLSVPAPGQSPHTACAERWNHAVTDGPRLQLRLPGGQASYCPGAPTFRPCHRSSFAAQVATVLLPGRLSVAPSGIFRVFGTGGHRTKALPPLSRAVDRILKCFAGVGLIQVIFGELFLVKDDFRHQFSRRVVDGDTPLEMLELQFDFCHS